MVNHNATLGHYTATYNAMALGNTEEGWIWEIVHRGEVLRFEEFSQNAIDLIMQGADVFIEAVLTEWNSAGLSAALWPHSSTFGKIDCAARFAVDGNIAQPLILTANSCSPAGTDGPATITFHEVIFVPEVAARINLNNDPRAVPVRFQAFLSDRGSADYRYFTIT